MSLTANDFQRLYAGLERASTELHVPLSVRLAGLTGCAVPAAALSMLVGDEFVDLDVLLPLLSVNSAASDLNMLVGLVHKPLNMGVIDAAEALRCFAKLAAAYPDEASVHAGWADTLMATGHFTEALQEARIAFELAPSVRNQTKLALILACAGDVAGGRELARTNLERAGDDWLTRLYLGKIELIDGRANSAMALLARAAEVAAAPQERAWTWSWQAYAFAVSGQLDAAMDRVEAEQALGLAADELWASNTCVVLAMRGSWAETLALHRLVYARYPQYWPSMRKYRPQAAAILDRLEAAV